MYPELEPSVPIGQVLAGKYRIDRVLGAGGMGIVVAATHLALDQQVALKFIRPEAMRNPEIVSRFEREARAAVRLKSEHVARILDVGRLETGSPFIVMEHLEGQDLSGLLAQVGPLGVPLASDFIVQACDAIAEAHALGIVHRDLKPGNLFLANTSHGQQIVKVLDFGISKSQLPGGDPGVTRTQAVMGSPGYMSPEQMRSAKNVDGRTDLWSLGVILYELVAGRAPFHADTFTALCLKVAMDPHPPLPALPARLPEGFEAVVNRALEKDPARRYGSAIELAQALAPFGTAQTLERARRLSASPAGVRASGSHAFAGATPVQSTLHAAAGQVRTGAPASGGRLRKLALAGIGICVASGLAVGVGAAALRGGQGERHAATAQPAPLDPPSRPAAPDAPPAPPPPPPEASPEVDPGPSDAGVTSPPPADAPHRRASVTDARPSGGRKATNQPVDLIDTPE